MTYNTRLHIDYYIPSGIRENIYYYSPVKRLEATINHIISDPASVSRKHDTTSYIRSVEDFLVNLLEDYQDLGLIDREHTEKLRKLYVAINEYSLKEYNIAVIMGSWGSRTEFPALVNLTNLDKEIRIINPYLGD